MSKIYDAIIEEVIRQTMIYGCFIIPIEKKMKLEKDAAQNRINYIVFHLNRWPENGTKRKENEYEPQEAGYHPGDM